MQRRLTLKTPDKSNLFIFLAVLLLSSCIIPAFSVAHSGHRITFLHYWTGDMSGGINEMVEEFNRLHPETVVKAAGFEHETFKKSIDVMLEAGNPPDFFSYWAGARTRNFVDRGYLMPMDDIWQKAGLKSVFGNAITEKCTYNGKIYALPVTQHYVAFFYNRSIFKNFGLEPPATWQKFTELCEFLKKKGITPLSLGSKEKWPAQFWFDFILLRTAGPEYRQKLMEGKASYTDQQVIDAFSIWKELIKKGYFNTKPELLDWAEASKMVHNGEAAMTLMGTWIIGQFETKLKWRQEKDFDFFSFPVMSEGVPNIALGPIDCILIPRMCDNNETVKKAVEYFSWIEPQKAMSIGSGALSPNMGIPDSFYQPVQARIRNAINRSEGWAFNYDLATPPDVAETGLECFSRFLEKPECLRDILKSTETAVRASFRKHQTSGNTSVK